MPSSRKKGAKQMVISAPLTAPVPIPQFGAPPSPGSDARSSVLSFSADTGVARALADSPPSRMHEKSLSMSAAAGRPGTPPARPPRPSTLNLHAIEVEIPSSRISGLSTHTMPEARQTQTRTPSPAPSASSVAKSVRPLVIRKPAPEYDAPPVGAAAEADESDIAFRQAPPRSAHKSLYAPGSGRPQHFPASIAVQQPPRAALVDPTTDDQSFRSSASAAFDPASTSPVMTTVVPEKMSQYGRKASLVNPEDYMPGLPAAVSPGRAMSAGFEPVRTSSLTRASYVPAPIGRRKSSLKKAVPVDTAAATADSADITDVASTGVSNAYDQDKVYGAGDGSPESRKSSLASTVDSYAMPVLYNNTYFGNHIAGTEMKNVQDSLPRDPVTGKIDWRAKFAVRSPAEVDQIRFLDVKADLSPTEKLFPHPYLSDANSAVYSTMSEKSTPESHLKRYFSDSASFSPSYHKASPHIVARASTKYSYLGRIMLRLSPFTFLLSSAAAGLYLFMRTTALMKAERQTGRQFIAAWIFLISEIVFAAWTFVYSLYQLITLRIAATPRFTIKGDVALPTVDVLIVCSGQDAGTIMDATVAAARLDWPVDKLRVLVVDETGSEVIKRSVEYYATNRALHVTYHRRARNCTAPRDGWSKSATINFGLAETRAEGRISGEYIAVLEAESIPEPDFLRTTLPHMLQNPLLALVETPSGFYNLPKKLGMAFSTFVRSVEPVQDSRSGFVLRRAAVDDIGGLPTRSSVEDKTLASCLQGRGYKTTWIDDTVQYSMVPDSFSQHLRQRVGRQLAHVSTAFRLGFFLFSRRTVHMPFTARMQGIGRAFTPFLSTTVFLNMMAYPVALFYGGFLVPALTMKELKMMLWTALAAIVTERVHDFFFAMPSGQASARRFIQSQVFMAPYTILGMLRGLVPRFMRKAEGPYWIADEFGEPKERDPKGRKFLGERLCAVMFGSHGWTHALVIAFGLAAVGYSLWATIMPLVHHERTLHQTGLLVLMTVAWPTLPWVNVLLGSIVPFVYAMFPPSVPSREQLLHREPISAVARPIPERRRMRPFRQGFFGQFMLSFILVAYACFVVILTFVDLHVK